MECAGHNNKLLVVDLTVSTLLCGTGAYADNVSSIFYSTVYSHKPSTTPS